jgi:hypothetical protein
MLAEHRSAARVGFTGGNFKGIPFGGGCLEVTPTRPLDQGFTEFLSESELQQVRAVWWRLRAAGVDLPAERGVVTLPGGAR